MAKLFISHSSDDDAIVRALQQALGELEQDVWIPGDVACYLGEGERATDEPVGSEDGINRGATP